MELKELTILDREPITKLFKDVFTKEPWNDDWSDSKQLDAYISDLVGQGYSLTLGYMDGGRLIGLSMGHIKHWHTGTEYCIEEFCIDRRLQGRGIGRSFFHDMEGYLSENGITQIFLQTERTVPAYGFYRHLGFIEMPDHISFAKRISRQT